jgi:RHS repeat-associated protein
LQYTYQYDTADRLTTQTSPAGNSAYAYDAFDQLLGATHDFQADESYSYDDMGNRSNNGEVIGAANRLLENNVFSYEYDGEGNRTKRTNKVTGESAEYSYDYRNRLTSVVTKDSGDNVQEVVSYSYNVFDQRIERSDSGGTQQFGVRSGLVEMVFDGDGNLTNRYLHAPYTDGVLVDERLDGDRRASTLLFPLADHQWTARDFVDESGNIVKQRRYDSYGNLTSDSAPTLDYLFDYTGREYDSSADLHYYRARYYDAGIGRFLSEDPIGLLGGDNNLHRYVMNAPVSNNDPAGLSMSDSFFDVPIPNQSVVQKSATETAEAAAETARIAKAIAKEHAEHVAFVAKHGISEANHILLQQLRRFIPDLTVKDFVEKSQNLKNAFNLRDAEKAAQVAQQQAIRRAEHVARNVGNRFQQASKFSRFLNAVNVFGWAADYGAMVIHVMGELHVAQLELGRAEMEAKWKKEIQDRKNELYMQGVRERLKKRLAEEAENNKKQQAANQANRAAEEVFDDQIGNFIRGKQGKKGLFGDMQNNFNNNTDSDAFKEAQKQAAKAKGKGGPQQVTPDAGNVQEDSASRALFNFLIQESKKRQQAQQNAGGNNRRDNCVPPNGK